MVQPPGRSRPASSLDRAVLRAPARVEARGLDNPVDLAFDDAGTLFVLEHGRFDQASGFLPGRGRLTVVGPGADERRDVLTGLTRPVTSLMLASGGMAVSSLDGTVAIVSAQSPPVRSGSPSRPCCNAWAAKPELPCHGGGCLRGLTGPDRRTEPDRFARPSGTDGGTRR